MYNRKHVLNRSYSSLEAEAIEKMEKKREDVSKWVEMVRDEKEPYKFKWSVVSTREANINSTGAVLGILRDYNLWDRFINEDIKKSGREWLESIHKGNGVYEDPALLSRKPPDWDDEKEGWPPTSGNREIMNRGGQGLYARFGGAIKIEEPPIPPDWPNLETIDTSLDWIKEKNSTSWTEKIIVNLIRWYREGKTDDEMLIKCLRHVYETQDPETGMWQNNIVSTFKYLVRLFYHYPFPLNHAEKILKTHMDMLYSPDYEPEGLFPCTELDLWFDVAMLLKHKANYPMEEIQKTALWRIIHIIDYYSGPDGGFKGRLDGCLTHWVDFDMAPDIMQSDIFGTRAFGTGIVYCADIADLHGKTSWNLEWNQHLSGDRRWKGEPTEEEEGLVPLSELSALVKEKLADVIV